MLRPSIILASAALLAGCAEVSPGESGETAAAPDREAVELPGKPEAEAEAPADDEPLRDMRPTEGAGASEEECENPVGAENPCIQGNYRPLPEEPESE